MSLLKDDRNKEPLKKCLKKCDLKVSLMQIVLLSFIKYF